MRPTPNLNSESLQKYGRRLFDRAARAFRAHPTREADAVLRTCMEALASCDACHAGAARVYFEQAARQLGEGQDSLNRLLAGRGDAAFTFVAEPHGGASS